MDDDIAVYRIVSYYIEIVFTYMPLANLQLDTPTVNARSNCFIRAYFLYKRRLAVLICKYVLIVLYSV